jgi:tRNA A-37 threonylcarbamoyl transferase component Bud32
MQKGKSVISAARRQKSLGTQKREEASAKKFISAIRTQSLKSSDFTVIAKQVTEVKGDITSKVVQTYGKQALKLLPEGFHFTRKLGSGKFGATFQICHSKLHCMALKIIELHRDSTLEMAYEEFDTQQDFAKDFLAPNVIGDPQTWKANGKNWFGFKMERIDGTLLGLLKKDILTEKALNEIIVSIGTLLGLLIVNKKTHGDLHTDNIAYRNVEDDQGHLVLELLLIDFGFSVEGIVDTRVELLQLGRTLLIDVEEGEEKNKTLEHNAKYIFASFKEILRNSLGVKNFSYEHLDDLFDKHWKAYLKKADK